MKRLFLILCFLRASLGRALAKWARRSVGGALDIPAMADAIDERAVSYANLSRQVGKGYPLSSIDDKWSRALVVRLFELGGPSTVSWFVVAVIVDTVKAAAGRSWTHIGAERSEGLSPSVTYRDAPSSIEVEGSVCGAKASTKNSGPDHVFGRAFQVPDAFSPAGFVPTASTAFCVAAEQMLRLCRDSFAAVAAALPIHKSAVFTALSVTDLDRNQSAKPLCAQVFSDEPHSFIFAWETL